jgi:predicted Fe-S protein YdhL (DUF1289 family)
MLRYTTEDTRNDVQVSADDRTREDVERGGGVWSQMSPQQREQVLGRLRDKKQRAMAERSRKQAEHETLEDRVSRLEERVARLGG